MKPGVYQAQKKDGTLYYRASITFQNKHISLGSFETETLAHKAYLEAKRILSKKRYTLASYTVNSSLTFQKWVCLLNFRDNKIYIKTPIYLHHRYFLYYFAPEDYYIFDVDDLFYFSTHSIMRRGGHLFVSDYGMQLNILSRYGIKNYGVPGRDYRYVNGNSRDYRYNNIEIYNKYHGVCEKHTPTKNIYEARINVNGYLLVGRYPSEIEAAVAYNKAASTLIRNGIDKKFPVNYIEELSQDEYKNMFKSISIRSQIKSYR